MDAVTTEEIGRFFEKVEITESEDDCWLWTGGKSNGGYGAFKIRGKMVGAHRVAWELTNGSISAGLCCCHRCDTPSCCNPTHLFLGTHTENMADCMAKGRIRTAYTPGVLNGQHKLTEGQVIEIRQRYAVGGISQRELGEKFGVARSTISDITRRRKWRHVLEPYQPE